MNYTDFRVFFLKLSSKENLQKITTTKECSVLYFVPIISSLHVGQTPDIYAKMKFTSYSKNSVMYFRLHFDHIQGLV